MTHSLSEEAAVQAQASAIGRDARRSGGEAERFELLYRGHVRVVMGFFARRSRDPQTVFDLTADAFVEAMRSFSRSTPAAGRERGWLLTIASRVYAQHCEQTARRTDAERRELARHRLGGEEIEELLERIDGEHEGRRLLSRLACLPAIDREAVELVDLAGLAPGRRRPRSASRRARFAYGYSGRVPG